VTPDETFPVRKDFPDGRFAYVVPLTFGRGRICVTTADDPLSVRDGF
jgi:hypothetical protein